MTTLNQMFFTMNHTVVTILFFPLMLACSNNNNEDRVLAIEESLRRSNTIIASENTRLLREMEYKLQDPVSVAKANIWQPKMQEVRELTDSVINFIDSVKSRIKKDPNAIEILIKEKNESVYNRLTRYRSSLLAILQPDEFYENPDMKQHLTKMKVEFDSSILTIARPDAAVDKPAKIYDYFQKASVLESEVMLEKIDNDVLHASNTLLTFFDSQTMSYRDQSFNTFSAIVTKNTNYLKQGDLLEVYAGVGSFSDAMKPAFVVNGKNMQVIDGRITYQLRIKDNPGKHRIPVTISYIQPDGRPRTFTVDVNYTVIK